MDSDGIKTIGAPADLFEEEERILNTPITGGGGEDIHYEGVRETPSPQKKGTVTSASKAKAMKQMKRDLLRIQPAYDHIEDLIGRAIIDGDEDSVLIDLHRFGLTEGDLGKIRDAYAREGWRVDPSAEPQALTFSLPD